MLTHKFVVAESSRAAGKSFGTRTAEWHESAKIARLPREEGTIYRAPTGDVPLNEPEHRRRSIRLRGVDYSEPGAYFVTICAANRSNLFGTIENGRALLTPLGNIVNDCWIAIPKHFPTVTLKEFVVMPNHLHGIIVLGGMPRPITPTDPGTAKVGARYIVPFVGKARRAESFQKPTKASIPTIVRAFKAAVTRVARESLLKRLPQIWQRNYFERVLRDGQEYADASRYILENPKKWEWDKQNPHAKRLPSGKISAKFD